MSNDCIINFESGLKRFVNSRNVYISCLLKFPNDLNYNKLCLSVMNNNYNDAFEAAHELKGLTGNLSLDLLYKSCCKLVEKLRKNDLNDFENTYLELCSNYNITIRAINELDT